MVDGEVVLNNTSKTLLDVPIQVGYLIIFGKEATCVLNSVNINASIRPRDTVAGTYAYIIHIRE